MIPEEDKFLEKSKPCVHDWVDLYGGSGVSKYDVELAVATFFCKKCLNIRTKTYDQSMYWLSAEVREDFEKDKQ
jgi:hypothetical protein